MWQLSNTTMIPYCVKLVTNTFSHFNYSSLRELLITSTSTPKDYCQRRKECLDEEKILLDLHKTCCKQHCNKRMIGDASTILR